MGNSLQSYDDRALASQKANDETDCLLPLLPWVHETRIAWGGRRKEDERVVKTAFVDLCVTDFPALPAGEEGGSSLLWTRRPPEHKEEEEEEEEEGEGK